MGRLVFLALVGNQSKWRTPLHSHQGFATWRKSKTFYHLEYSDYCPQLHGYIYNVLTDASFFRCFMLNSETHTKLGMKVFIESTIFDCSKSINNDWVQVLSYCEYSLLFTCNWDWTCNLKTISRWSTFQPNTYICCIMCPARFMVQWILMFGVLQDTSTL